MIAIQLIHNLAILIAIAAIYPSIAAYFEKKLFTHQLVLGILFGISAVLGMMDPVQYENGIIFDGRSTVLAVSGLIGGPVVAATSVIIAGWYRVYLGGGGMPVGIATITASAAIGLIFHFIRKRQNNKLSLVALLGFGVLVQVTMLGLFLFLPNDAGKRVIAEMGLSILLSYSLATILISELFQNYEEQRTNLKHIKQLAFSDSITGLGNRAFLLENLTQLLSSSTQSTQAQGSLILLKIDRFKVLNDARGYAFGNQLLQSMSELIKTLISPSAVLTKISSDEFAILDYYHRENAQPIELLAAELASDIRNILKQPLHVGTDDITISVSIGIVICPQHLGDNAGDILRFADTAMHRAQQNGGNQVMLFNQSMLDSVEQRHLIECELRQAILNNELRLFLQSQVDATGKIVAAEALVRWQHPLRGLLQPGAFIPIAEETNLIIDVTQWVLTEACTFLASEQMANHPLRVSVNISARDFNQSSFIAKIKHILTSTGANPAHLTLEVTEGLLIDNVNEVVEKMHILAALGIHFSLDDFGTGYSSLAYLKMLPLNEIKIDKTFVQSAPTNSDDAALIESVFAIAKNMGLLVVAEGVETQAQADFLNARHPLLHQGYLYCKPEPATVWVKRLFPNTQTPR